MLKCGDIALILWPIVMSAHQNCIEDIEQIDYKELSILLYWNSPILGEFHQYGEAFGTEFATFWL